MTLYSYNLSFPYTRYVSATFPYTPELSKNQKKQRNMVTGRTYLCHGYRSAKRLIALKFKSLTAYHNFEPRTPVLVVITVYSKTRSCDAHNYAEGACDAIEAAIGVNDRWFQVYTIPKVDKKNPRIEIEVMQ